MAAAADEAAPQLAPLTANTGRAEAKGKGSTPHHIYSRMVPNNRQAKQQTGTVRRHFIKHTGKNKYINSCSFSFIDLISQRNEVLENSKTATQG